MNFFWKIASLAIVIRASATQNVRLRNKEDEFYNQIKSASLSSTTELTEEDIIYAQQGYKEILSPVVIEEYKFVFFAVAKVASTAWIRMLVKMEGRSKWCAPFIHKPEINELKHLYDYPIEVAQEMMTSEDWTRSIFVRNPHERLLSAFLDKAVNHSEKFVEKHCQGYRSLGGNIDDCINNHKDFDFFLRNITALVHDAHWAPLYEKIDTKWWPHIDYIGRFEDLPIDSEALLRSLFSSEDDGVSSAWEKYGATGWSEREKNCTGAQNQAFLETKEERHSTEARAKLHQYYTPELWTFVSEKYAIDIKNPFYSYKDFVMDLLE